MPDPVVHFEIAARDAQKLQAFYGELFEWDIDADNPMSYGLVTTEVEDDEQGVVGINGAIYNYNAEDENEKPGIRIYIQVDDADEYADLAEELGGKSLGPAQEVPGFGIKVGGIVDPEGNIIGVIEALDDEDEDEE